MKKKKNTLDFPNIVELAPRTKCHVKLSAIRSKMSHHTRIWSGSPLEYVGSTFRIHVGYI